jgi:REP element-mobilizing transposase RayT
MGRDLRIVEPGGIYHVTSRGSGERDVFGDDVDCEAFLVLLALVVRRWGWVCLSYCLMTTHYHLVLQLPTGELSCGMQALNGRFSRRTSRRYGSHAHLFENRFAGKTIADDTQLREAARDVVLSPVRAGVCDDPAEYRWSSYRACAGLDFAPSFLAVGAHLELFGSTPEQAVAMYRRFVREGHVPVSDTGGGSATTRS